MVKLQTSRWSKNTQNTFFEGRVTLKTVLKNIQVRLQCLVPWFSKSGIWTGDPPATCSLSPKLSNNKNLWEVVVSVTAGQFIVTTIKRSWHLFMHFSFLVVPSGRGKREYGVEAVKEIERCLHQWTTFWLRKCFPRLQSGHCGNNTGAVFIGQTSPCLLNTISCNLYCYYLQRDACCMALSPEESHPLYSLLQS